MKIVYASRTGNVENFVNKLGVTDTVHIESGDETVTEEFVLVTYTDGYGEVPYEVETFLPKHKELIKAVVASGDIGYGEEVLCKAGDIIAEEYHVPCLHKFENDGTDEDVEKTKEAIANL